MTDMKSTEYHVARERRERELADAATDPMISAIHLAMAKRYAELVRHSRSGPGDRSQGVERYAGAS